MEPPPIAPVVPRPTVRRVPGQQKKSSEGAFERAFEQESDRREDGADRPAEPPAPSRLQRNRPAVRKYPDRGEHTIDVLV